MLELGHLREFHHSECPQKEVFTPEQPLLKHFWHASFGAGLKASY